ncbi:MAG: division/cell wall cluster transcriptional repressor MraZ [Alphaproteobacteria bacterium]
MAGFFSTYTNKVDKKGRVSVPASFRTALAAQNFQGVIVFPSFKNNAIEAWSMARMQTIMDSVESLALFSDDQDDLKAAIFASAKELGFDNEGRIILSEEFKQHAGIDDQAVFVGMGQTFQIWNPADYAAHKKEIQTRMMKMKPVLKTVGV